MAELNSMPKVPPGCTVKIMMPPPVGGDDFSEYISLTEQQNGTSLIEMIGHHGAAWRVQGRAQARHAGGRRGDPVGAAGVRVRRCGGGAGLRTRSGFPRPRPGAALAEVGADQLLATAAEVGLEGIVSKRADAIYEPGRRSSAWIKTVLRASTEAVIVGAMPGSGPNAATFGGLVLAGHTPEGRLRCIGGVGTGFIKESRRTLRAALEEIRRDTSPLDDPAPAPVRRAAWWVEPVLVADIEYREVSGDGLLRHPSFRGIRTDKASDEVGLPS